MFEGWESTKFKSAIIKKKIIVPKKNEVYSNDIYNKKKYSLEEYKSIMENKTTPALLKHSIRCGKFISESKSRRITSHQINIKMNSTQKNRFENITSSQKILSKIASFSSIYDIIGLLTLSKKTFSDIIVYIYTHLQCNKTNYPIFKVGILKSILSANSIDHELTLLIPNGNYRLTLFRQPEFEGVNMLDIFETFIRNCSIVIINSSSLNSYSNESIPVFNFKTYWADRLVNISEEISREMKMDRKMARKEIKTQKEMIKLLFSGSCEDIHIKSDIFIKSNNEYFINLLSRSNPSRINFEEFTFEPNFNYYYMIKDCSSLKFSKCIGVCNIVRYRYNQEILRIDEQKSSESIYNLILNMIIELNMLNNNSISKLIYYTISNELDSKELVSWAISQSNKISPSSDDLKDYTNLIELLCEDGTKFCFNLLKDHLFMLNEFEISNSKYFRVIATLFDKILEKSKSVYVKHLSKIWNTICDTIEIYRLLPALNRLVSLSINNCAVKVVEMKLILKECSILEKLELNACNNLSCDIFNPDYYEFLSSNDKFNDIRTIKYLKVVDIPDFFNDTYLFLPPKLKKLKVASIKFLNDNILKVLSKMKLNSVCLKWCTFINIRNIRTTLDSEHIKIIHNVEKLGLPMSTFITATNLVLSSNLLTMYILEKDDMPILDCINNFIKTRKNEIYKGNRNVTKGVYNGDIKRIKETGFTFKNLKNLTIIGPIDHILHLKVKIVCKFRKINFKNVILDPKGD